MFTVSELERLASWGSLESGFDLLDTIPRSESQWRKRIEHPLMTRLKRQCSASVVVSAHGQDGHSTYFHFFFHPDGALKRRPAPRGEELEQAEVSVVYLSLLTPVAVFGRGTYSVHRSPKGHGWSHPSIDLDTALDPAMSRLSDLEKCVLDAVADHGYRFPPLAELEAMLPAHIRPQEYCLGRQPWDKIFHVLFANTD
ncbi:hypothetical protein B1810_12420 [Panacagrimonas perspica]|uniref:hypothetical protein n=1 Tax=Panacagrimonas perspica TaxID=381431 RepID=UPI00105FA37F|nr:hypothetical protein [Panacagrimonas perspica]THD02726.1 hypothetical protein B1810_12420 [Panacagrimonas perspica]